MHLIIPSDDSKKDYIDHRMQRWGIGEALALAFHQRKHRVIATVRDLLKATTLADAGIDVLEMDVCQHASIESVVKQIIETGDGGLDILVNNAGIGENSRGAATVEQVTYGMNLSYKEIL